MGSARSYRRRGWRLGVAGAVGAATIAVVGLPGGSAGAAAPTPAQAQPQANVTRTAETVSTVRIGPFVLPPAPLGSAPHVNRPLPEIPKPCQDCFITGIEPRLVFADGRRADMTDGVMLHHLVIAAANKTDVTCGRAEGIGAMGRRLFASGDERTAIQLPDGFGFRVEPGPWVGVAELMNHGDVPQVVFFEAVVRHVPASTPGMKAVTPVWLDVNNCLTSEYAVPEGESATEWSWESTLTGRIVAAGGHVHPGGRGITLDNATTDKRICSSRAGYGSDAMEGMIASMSTCSWDRLGVLHAGDTLTITSIYDAPRAMSDVMGIMLIAVYETDDLAGGTRAPASLRATPTTTVPAAAAHTPGHSGAGSEHGTGADSGHDDGGNGDGGHPPH